MVGLLNVVQAVAFALSTANVKDATSSRTLLICRMDTSVVSDNGEETLIPSSLSVCLSPGCKADGAELALEKLKALAPPHVTVEGGPCRSFCGSGPVVVSDSPTGVNGKMKTVPHKRISSEERIIDLLYSDGAVNANLVKGYNFGAAGDEAFEKKNYGEAVKFYEDAVSFGFRPAIELQDKRDRFEQKRTQKKQCAEATNNTGRLGMVGARTSKRGVGKNGT
mmetsp:Transcript_14009/g.31777  ORF Transcript_14009/g.31777 Transcript_14009/m.31777 type:complete len:222 (+) Transcript_14009:92-757(+)